jgi:hypothetical protein
LNDPTFIDATLHTLWRGAGALPFGERIVTVRALIERLLTPESRWSTNQP